MSNYRFGDDHKLNVYPREAIDCWGELDIDKVEAIEIDWVDFIRKPDNNNRWFQLFGTPERAARTIAGIACDKADCRVCSLRDAPCTYTGTEDLEWLRGDAE